LTCFRMLWEGDDGYCGESSIYPVENHGFTQDFS
jgi:hypothetical protein